MGLLKHALGIYSRHSFNETRAMLQGHLGDFITKLHYITTDGVPTMHEHLVLMRSTPLTLLQLQNGAVVPVRCASLTG
jgi:hypothetical protein